VTPARTYRAVDDLWVLTAYFNPLGYATRRRNYDVFQATIEASHLRSLTVECAFGGGAFALPESPHVLRVRAADVMWQKERLLNLAVARLPASCAKIAWVDCDVLFDNPEWAVETSRLLERSPVVQPFDSAIRLPRGAVTHDGGGETWRGFGAVHAVDPHAVRTGDYDTHGETGLAWAARREVLARCGLYDACIVGGGDHAIAHAMCGDFDSACIAKLIGVGNRHWRHFVRWGTQFCSGVRGRIGHVPGAILHLWHGHRADRQYAVRHRRLEGFAFEPQCDLRVGGEGGWEWATVKPDMHRTVAEYFAGRDEDGAAHDRRAP
jgi:hypothetical protein